MMDAHMAPTAKRIMEQVLAVRPGERMVIVTDFERPRSITDLLTTAATLYGLQAVVVAMPARDGRRARLTAPEGTDLQMDLTGRTARPRSRRWRSAPRESW